MFADIFLLAVSANSMQESSSHQKTKHTFFIPPRWMWNSNHGWECNCFSKDFCAKNYVSVTCPKTLIQVGFQHLETDCPNPFKKLSKEELLWVLDPVFKHINPEPYLIGTQVLTSGKLAIYSWISTKNFADVVVGKPFRASIRRNWTQSQAFESLCHRATSPDIKK